jgi:catechol 2,3-dioxygenase-like lactoylglutathione lyase family enzyme
MIGRLYSTVIDCPEPRLLAEFYSAITGWPVTDEEPDWVDLTSPDGARLSFQLAPDLLPPRWPDPQYPQQVHLDVDVDDIDVAQEQVLALGARPLPGGGDKFRVYADPAGHPFCLVWHY